MNIKNRLLTKLIILLFIPIIVYIGVTVFADRSYLFIASAIAFLSIATVYITFEQKETSTRKLVILAVLIAISVVGRFIFAALPGFKPVTAIVVLAAMYFGAEAGFLVGSLSALISNIYFGQGPWTPFQMVSWGMIGFMAGLPYMSKILRGNKVILCFYGIFAGVIFSLMMDVWTVMSMEGTFNWTRYTAAVSLSFPFMAVYALSNVVFLLLTIRPIGEKLERIKKKYNL